MVCAGLNGKVLLYNIIVFGKLSYIQSICNAECDMNEVVNHASAFSQVRVLCDMRVCYHDGVLGWELSFLPIFIISPF